ncbi:hypothetical protein [Streptomyces sp. DW26H14]|uniref:hypothetical protein n=1 Tax=Streptomyces sp. DW26H14 TaxID=3435395 RepID=UPI00403E2782
MTTLRFIADAAAPIAQALTAVQRLGVPSTDVLISYTAHGCVVRVADRSAVHRVALEMAVCDAFTAAGWGVSVRHAVGLALAMEHPSELTRH